MTQGNVVRTHLIRLVDEALGSGCMRFAIQSVNGRNVLILGSGPADSMVDDTDEKGGLHKAFAETMSQLFRT